MHDIKDKVKTNYLKHIALICDFSENELARYYYNYHENINKVLDLICDTSAKEIFCLNEKSILYLRKRLGVYNNGMEVIYSNIEKDCPANARKTVLNAIEIINNAIIYDVDNLYLKTKRELLKIDIGALLLDRNIYNYLKRDGINKIGNLTSKSKVEICFLNGIEPVSCDIIINRLNKLGLDIFDKKIFTKISKDKYNVSIDYLNFSKKAYPCLKNNDINVFGDFLSKTEYDIYNIANSNASIYNEIINKLKRFYLARNLNEYLVNCPIEDLSLSIRAYNCLKRSNINTVGDIIANDVVDLGKIKSLGINICDEIVNKIESLNLTFVPDYDLVENQKHHAIIEVKKNELLRKHKEALNRRDSILYKLETINKEIESIESDIEKLDNGFSKTINKK